MKIRSITYFCNPKYPLNEKILQNSGTFLAEAKSAYEAAGYEVQFTRLATIPFPKLLGEKKINELPRLAEPMDTIIQSMGIAYASFGPALPKVLRSYEIVPEAIAASQNIFFGGVMADKNNGLSLSAIKACAEIIQKVSSISLDGLANSRFAALANVSAGSPFFPAAYHDKNKPAFALATESADLAVKAFDGAKTIKAGRKALVAQIEKHGKKLAKVAKSLDCKFDGIDFSLAPFPSEAQSLGTAFEKLGVPKIGLHGSLLAAAILAESIDRADFPRTGFSGLMMPVLEDATLAKRVAEGTLTVKDILLYSAVCGTGLDTIPLPGETTSEQLVPLLLDLCALALRLDKPLTARLMPIPNKNAGDETNFDFAFFAPSRVLAIDSSALNFPLTGQEVFQINKRLNV